MLGAYLLSLVLILLRIFLLAQFGAGPELNLESDTDPEQVEMSYPVRKMSICMNDTGINAGKGMRPSEGGWGRVCARMRGRALLWRTGLQPPRPVGRSAPRSPSSGSTQCRLSNTGRRPHLRCIFLKLIPVVFTSVFCGQECVSHRFFIWWDDSMGPD